MSFIAQLRRCKTPGYKRERGKISQEVSSLDVPLQQTRVVQRRMANLARRGQRVRRGPALVVVVDEQVGPVDARPAVGEPGVAGQLERGALLLGQPAPAPVLDHLVAEDDARYDRDGYEGHEDDDDYVVAHGGRALALELGASQLLVGLHAFAFGSAAVSVFWEVGNNRMHVNRSLYSQRT